MAETPLSALRGEMEGFDLVIEATGDAQAMLDAIGMLRRGGVACLLGIDGRPRQLSIEAKALGVDMVQQNRAVFGSMNAHRIDWRAAALHLDEARARWPEALGAFVGRRVEPDRYEDAFAYRGVKATLQLGDA